MIPGVWAALLEMFCTKEIWAAIVGGLLNIGGLVLGGWLFARRIEEHRIALSVKSEIAKEKLRRLTELFAAYSRVRWHKKLAETPLGKLIDRVSDNVKNRSQIEILNPSASAEEAAKASVDFLAKLNDAQFYLGEELANAFATVCIRDLAMTDQAAHDAAVKAAELVIEHHRALFEQGKLPQPATKTKTITEPR